MAEKKLRLVTPIGIARWAHVHTPKPGYKDPTTGKEGAPKFAIDVVFDPKGPSWAAFVKNYADQLKALPVQKDKDGDDVKKQSPFCRDLDDNDQPTGKVYCSFKTGANFKPGVFDRFGREIPPSILIGNGSKVQVNYTPNVYESFGGGINFYLNSILVKELVEYQKTDAKAYGFEVEQPPEGEEPPTQGDPDDIPF